MRVSDPLPREAVDSGLRLLESPWLAGEDLPGDPIYRLGEWVWRWRPNRGHRASTGREMWGSAPACVERGLCDERG